MYSLLEVKSKEIKGLAATQAVPIINKTTFSKVKVRVPDKNEQKKIADFLTAVDQKIAQLTEKKLCLEQYKKGVMQRLFTQRLRFRDTNGNPFPDWEEEKLGDVSKIRKGEQLNRENMNKSGYPVLNGGKDYSGYTETWNSEKNTITISEGGNSCGYVSFMKERFWSGGHLYTLEPINSRINSSYLYQQLKYIEPKIMALTLVLGFLMYKKDR